MKKYFYTDGTNSMGPFTIEELKEKGITRETSVWFHELGEWKEAGTVQELKELFAFVPPPIQKQNISNQQHPPKLKTNNSIDIFVFFSIAYWFTSTLASFLIRAFVDDWYDTPAKYFDIGTNIIFAAAPIVFALSIRNRTLKIIAVILSSLLSIYILYSNIDWLILELN